MYAAPRWATFVKYGKVELMPPSPAEIPAAIGQLAGLVKSAMTMQFRHTPVKVSPEGRSTCMRNVKGVQAGQESKPEICHWLRNVLVVSRDMHLFYMLHTHAVLFDFPVTSLYRPFC